HACALVTAWLESLPRLAVHVPGTVVESSCASRGGRACMHTLLWQPPKGSSSPKEGSPKDAGTSKGPGSPRRNGAPPAAARAATPPAAARAATPPAAPSGGTVVPGGGTPASPGVSTTGRPGPRFGRRSTDLAPPAAGPATEALARLRQIALPSSPPVPGTGHTTPSPATGHPTAPPETEPLDPASATASPAAGTLVPVGGAPAEPTAVTSRAVPLPPGTRVGRGTRRWAWLRRRAWILAIGLVAGAAGGHYASAHHASSFGATSVLVVRSGASPSGPGSANDAEALAITDAALLPSDQAVVGPVARRLGVPASEVSHDMIVDAEAGTALMQVSYSASSPARAVAGANDIARVVSGVRPNDQAVANGSVAVVSSAKSASSSGSLYKHGLVLGAVLGLLLGAAAALAAERSDRRVDDGGALAEATDCPVTVVPGGISPTELARAVERAAGGSVIELVPLRQGQAQAAHRLAWELAGPAPDGGAEPAGRPPAVAPAFADAPDILGQGQGPTVLVVGAGERVRAVSEVTERLRRLGRAPVWSVLVTAG
ncbi:MAG: hypothetical protein ACRDWN_08790, partial [Acidimicrobiales bacterium]